MCTPPCFPSTTSVSTHLTKRVPGLNGLPLSKRPHRSTTTPSAGSLWRGWIHRAMMACKEGSQRDGSMRDLAEERYHWFAQQGAKNLHVIFTMNLPEHRLVSWAATSPGTCSPQSLGSTEWHGIHIPFLQMHTCLPLLLTVDLRCCRYIETQWWMCWSVVIHLWNQSTSEPTSRVV